MSICRSAVVFLCFVAGELGMHAQTDRAGKPGVFDDRELKLRVYYPTEMVREDPAAVAERGHQAIYGKAGDENAEHREAIKCMRPKFVVDLPLSAVKDHAAQINGEQPSKLPATGTIALAEVGSGCLPKDMRGNLEGSAAAVANSVLESPGLHRVGQPMWYQVGDQRVHVAAAQGTLQIGRADAIGAVMMMQLTTVWKDRLLMWSIFSNDQAIFNDLSKLVVQFGDAPAMRLFPMKIGTAEAGKPVIPVKD